MTYFQAVDPENYAARSRNYTNTRALMGLGSLGSTASNDAAKKAQQFLVTNGGAKIAVDGIFGPQSVAAQTQYAKDGLAAANGVGAGLKTMPYAGSAATAKMITDFVAAQAPSSTNIGQIQSQLFSLMNSAKNTGGSDVTALPAFNRVNTFLQYPAVQVTATSGGTASGGNTSTPVPVVVSVSPKLPSLTISKGKIIAAGLAGVTLLVALYYSLRKKPSAATTP